MSWGSRGSSQFAVGNSGFLSICDSYFGEPLELHKGSQASFRVSRGILGLFLRRCRGKWPHLMLRPKIQGSSHVVTGISGLLSSFNIGVRPSLILRHGTLLSTRVVKWGSNLILSFEKEYGIALEALQGKRDASGIDRESCGVSRVAGETLGSSQVGTGEGNGTPLQYSCLENPMDGGA